MANVGSPKVRAKSKDGLIEVKAIIKHPMETGLRKDKKTGEAIPAHFITEVSAEYNGKTVMSADLSGGVSANPFLAFYVRDAGGGSITMHFKDNKGGSWSQEAKVK